MQLWRTIIHSHWVKTFQWGCFGVTLTAIGNPAPSTHWLPRVMTFVCQWDLIEEEIDFCFCLPKEGNLKKTPDALCAHGHTLVTSEATEPPTRDTGQPFVHLLPWPSFSPMSADLIHMFPYLL